MRKAFFQLIATLLFSSLSAIVFAQNIPVGTPLIEEYYRRLQLTGKIDQNLSFTSRPINHAALPNITNLFDPDEDLKTEGWIALTNRTKATSLKNIDFKLLPIVWKQQYNSHNPYGWNDGAMIPSKGYQTLFSAGFYTKWGPLTIQLAPEFVYASNDAFETLGKRNNIDLPERFGDKAFQQLFWGQSSIRLNFGPASIGISNENLWWGPGQRNSLLMSNNAPGFKHITLNTVKPIKSYIGSFEAQFISGKLESSNIAPYDESYPQNEWRYLSGMNVSYQPKWVPGLFLGFIRNFQAYHTDVKGFSGFVPFLTPFQKKNTNDGDEFPRDQILSFYTRWVFPKANAEIYFEFGQNDNSHDLRDFVGAPDHSRAYLVGFSKLVPLKSKKDEHLQVTVELTQLSQSIDRVLREAGSWYTHSQVRHGYTNKGQIVGAGMDLGGNLQSVDLSWVKGMKKVGLVFERYEHNPHDVPALLNGHSRRWVDLSLAGIANWNYKNLLLNAKIQGIKGLNYQWKLKDYDPSVYYIPHNDVFNFHGELGIGFRF
jgi:hypothetical protein